MKQEKTTVITKEVVLNSDDMVHLVHILNDFAEVPVLRGNKLYNTADLVEFCRNIKDTYEQS